MFLKRKFCQYPHETNQVEHNETPQFKISQKNEEIHLKKDTFLARRNVAKLVEQSVQPTERRLKNTLSDVKK